MQQLQQLFLELLTLFTIILKNRGQSFIYLFLAYDCPLLQLLGNISIRRWDLPKQLSASTDTVLVHYLGIPTPLEVLQREGVINRLKL